MKIEKYPFGRIKGQEISQYILSNDKVKVKIINYGATITSIEVPDKKGNLISIACGFDELEDYFSEEYKANSPYFGCTVGRYCSQIKDAKFELEGITYKLADNCGPNNLHGGTIGFDKKIWNAMPFEAENAVGVSFTLTSKDLEEGFPGNVQAEVQMKLTRDNEIMLNYSATTDKATPLSMTNHTYFNLSGFKRSVEDFTVKVNTKELLEMDETGAATGVVKDVSGTIEDLRTGTEVKKVHAELGDGFEHFYVFENPHFKLIEVAEITDKVSGRSLEVRSTEPCMLFYTGKYTSDKLQRNANEKYGKYKGFCCETHRWQNGPNIKNAPGVIAIPEIPFKSKTIFKLNF